MRSANPEQITHYTREQVADSLGISVDYLRLLVGELRRVLSPEEFDFQPHDGQISASAADKIREYRIRATQTTRKRTLEKIKVEGL